MALGTRIEFNFFHSYILPQVESVAPEITPLFLRISTFESFKIQAILLTEKKVQPFNFSHCLLQAATFKLGITLKSPSLNSKLTYMQEPKKEKSMYLTKI